MLPAKSNLLNPPRPVPPAERIVSLLERPGVRLEQIASFGQPTAPGEWYDQTTDEWVLLVHGCARLDFDCRMLEVSAGDYLTIPAHQRHRVDSCSDDAVWLALHYL